MKQLPQWTYEGNDIYGSNLGEMYDQVSTQFLRYMLHVSKYVGGTYIDYKTIDEAGAIYTPNPRAKQLDALNFIDEQLFNEPVWLRSEGFVSRLTNNPQNLTESMGNSVLQWMMSSSFLRGLNDEFPVTEYLKTMTDKLCKEMWSGQAATSYRRALQGVYVSSLITWRRKRKRLLSPNSNACRRACARLHSAAPMPRRATIIRPCLMKSPARSIRSDSLRVDA